jgi:predicted dehydrogenase
MNHDKKLRGAIIGYGFIASRGHVPAYVQRSRELADVEIVAVADVSTVRRKLAQAALDRATLYSDYRDLLEAEAGRLDFVDIATPPCDHAAIAHAALARGLLVLCEKPLTRAVDEGLSLLDHARAAERVLFPCHNYKHAPVINAIRSIIQSGRIGPVRSAQLNIYRNTHARGVAEWNSHWRRDSRYSGGGIAMDHGSHSFYLTFEWLGSYPTSLTARMSNLDPGRYDTEDEFAAVLKFPMGTADVHLTWTASVRKMIYTIRGEKGVLTMEDDHLQIETANGGNGHGSAGAAFEDKVIPSQWTDASHASWFNPVFEEFRGAIATRDFAGKDAQEAVLCVELINTAYRSAREQSRELPLGWVPELGATMPLD